MILVWLRGGCSHLDTYDPKPDAPSEYRGPFATIATRTPGLRFTELLPRQAELSDRFTVLRSMAHTGGGHPAGSLQLLSGDPDRAGQAQAGLSRLHERRPLPALGPTGATLPNYVGVNPVVRLRQLHDRRPRLPRPRRTSPFAVTGDPNAPDFQRAQHRPGRPAGRSAGCASGSVCGRSFDDLRRDIDRSGAMDAMDTLRGPGARTC